MSPVEPGPERKESEIVDLPEASMSSEDAAQVKGGGAEVVLQPILNVLQLGVTAASGSVKLKTAVNGAATLDGASQAFANESYGVGGGSQG